MAIESAGTKGGIVDDACLLSSPFDYMSVLGQTSEDDALTLVDFSENVVRFFSAYCSILESISDTFSLGPKNLETTTHFAATR